MCLRSRQALRRPLTWDQGKEMNIHRQIAVVADVDVYFCAPHSLWQRAAARTPIERLRQYFHKGTVIPSNLQRLQEAADELNGRPRKVPGWRTPAEALAEPLDEQAASGKGGG